MTPNFLVGAVREPPENRIQARHRIKQVQRTWKLQI